MSAFYGRLVTPCPTCDGNGWPWDESVAADEITPCPDCSSGWVDLDATDECQTCFGDGIVCDDPWDVDGGHDQCARCSSAGRVPSLAALALPDDTVLEIAHSLVMELHSIDDVCDVWAEQFDGDGLNYGGPLSGLARVVTSQTEAARAAIHPDLAYPLEDQ